MTRCEKGALDVRRWGRILLVGGIATLCSACATNPETRLPPTGCNYSKSRPANPYGSVLVNPVVIGPVNPDGTVTPPAEPSMLFEGDNEAGDDRGAAVSVPAPFSAMTDNLPMRPGAVVTGSC